jgi:hypothetical protein
MVFHFAKNCTLKNKQNFVLTFHETKGLIYCLKKSDEELCNIYICYKLLKISHIQKMSLETSVPDPIQ